MRKIIFVFLALFCLGALSFGSEARSVKSAIKESRFDFSVGIQNSNATELFAQDTSNSGDSGNILTQYYKLFFGLTVAFGVASFTFLVMGIVFSAVYGVSNNMIRTTTNADDANRWHDSQSGLLAGTIASWSLFTLFALCGTACGIILIIASDNGKTKLTKLEIKPSLQEVSFDVAFGF
jgi:hypothetical protein